MREDIHEFLASHINTKRAQKCTPVQLKEESLKDDEDLEAMLLYKFDFSYPNSRLGPSMIKIGFKDNRPCIRIDEKERLDRNKFNDYFADDINCLRRFMQHISRMQRDYERTTWFVRAQLIPTLFKKVLELQKN